MYDANGNNHGNDGKFTEKPLQAATDLDETGNNRENQIQQLYNTLPKNTRNQIDFTNINPLPTIEEARQYSHQHTDRQGKTHTWMWKEGLENIQTVRKIQTAINQNNTNSLTREETLFAAKHYFNFETTPDQLYEWQASTDHEIADTALETAIDQDPIDYIDPQALNENWKQQKTLQALNDYVENGNYDREDLEYIGNITWQKFGWDIDDISPDLIHDARIKDETYQQQLYQESRNEMWD